MSTAAELPTGTVTFLFTDIEGSTRLLKQLRDGYPAVLADHQRIIREALGEQYRPQWGTLVDQLWFGSRATRRGRGPPHRLPTGRQRAVASPLARSS